MPETHLDKFKKLLAELFMFDQADLDFGIYRIMNAKRDEIIRFLDRDLLPQVREALGELEQADRAGVEAELMKAIEQAKSLGADTEALPKVKELRRQLGQKADVEALESEVFSDLFNFFRRYYSEGDFLSLRRYKEGVYAIPYEGEEVKLHWANADQYYIKTTEYFRDYTFKVPDGRRVHFKIAEADTEQNNNKPANGHERRFVLRDAEPVAEENGELVVRFEYRSDSEKRKQADLNALAVNKIVNTVEARAWLVGIATKAPTDKNPDRMLLDKHLSDYTARNTFDYFIHKDLGGFLRREIDFYIKNEVMHLDDIESETAPRVEQYLAKVRAIRRIAHKIIDFVAQFENFQKKLWLKKKFVVETNYFITLDRVPEELYPEIASNDSQREEWVRLFAINELSIDMTRPGYSAPLTVEFLKANSNLLLDTRFFPVAFTARLLSGIDNLDAACDGLLIQSENFQGLNLLASRLRNSVQYVYIDPPFNTDSAPILYKNDYRDSSWISLVRDRLELAQRMLVKRAVTTIAIDDTELPNLSKLIEHLFADARVTRVTVVHNPKGSITKDFNRVHEYAVFVTPEGEKSVIARSLEENETPRKLRRWGENSLRSDRPQSFYPIYVKDGKITRIGVVAGSDFHPSGKNVRVTSGEIEIWPIDQDGVERRWNFGLDSIEENLDRIIIQESDGLLDLFLTHEVTVSKTVWSGGKYDAGKYGNTLLIDMLGKKLFDFPKSVHLVKDCVYLATSKEKDSIVLDFFGGSGTTGHAVLMLNREDSGHRKFVLIEVGKHFDTVLKPRIEKAIYSDDWETGKPISRKGSSCMCKYIRLESYEDTLNNLEIRRTQEQGELLERNAAMREDYVLHYMLDVESKDSASLLDLDQFGDPFSYKLKVGTGSAGETRLTNVDLVETFNWLLGLRVRHTDSIRAFRVVQGTSPGGEKVLVIWRNTRETSNTELDEFFLKQGYNTRDMEFDLIYVNGDNNLENLRRPDETWKVRLIEEEFKSLMFDVEDV